MGQRDLENAATTPCVLAALLLLGLPSRTIFGGVSMKSAQFDYSEELTRRRGEGRFRKSSSALHVCSGSPCTSSLPWKPFPELRAGTPARGSENASKQLLVQTTT